MIQSTEQGVLAVAKKSFAYLRVSGKGQISGDGFPRQIAAIERYAKAHHIEVVQEFRDGGVSGATEGFDRSGLSDLMVAVKSNGTRIVLIERADRLARDLLVGEVILAEFRKAGVEVIAADSGVDLTVGDGDPTRVLIRQVLGAVAQFEKSAVVQKLRAARNRKRRDTGRCEGAKPFGELDGEAATLDRMMALYRKPRTGPRRSLQDIADALNTDGLRSRSGKPWSRGSVNKIVQRVKG